MSSSPQSSSFSATVCLALALFAASILFPEKESETPFAEQKAALKQEALATLQMIDSLREPRDLIQVKHQVEHLNSRVATYLGWFPEESLATN